MVEIRNIADKNEWNLLLAKNCTYSVFSSFEWGEYKKMGGWTVERLAFYNSGNFLGQCQFIYKKKYNAIISWNSGGILYSNLTHLKTIAEAAKEYFKSPFSYMRFYFYNVSEGKNLFETIETFSRPKKFINSNFSIAHTFSPQFDSLKSMNSNHRYYYKQAIKNNFSFKVNPADNIDDFVHVHNDMTQSKELLHLKINPADIMQLAASFEENILIFTVYLDEEPVASCLVLLSGKKAFYYLAASSSLGRKTYASYYMVKELFAYLSSVGIENFDFGGITPYNKEAHGVNKFKEGFGGEIVNYLGEWETSTSSLLSLLVNKVYL